MFILCVVASFIGCHPEAKPEYLSNIHTYICGAAPLPKQDIFRILEKSKVSQNRFLSICSLFHIMYTWKIHRVPNTFGKGYSDFRPRDSNPRSQIHKTRAIRLRKQRYGVLHPLFYEASEAQIEQDSNTSNLIYCVVMEKRVFKVRCTICSFRYFVFIKNKNDKPSGTSFYKIDLYFSHYRRLDCRNHKIGLIVDISR